MSAKNSIHNEAIDAVGDTSENFSDLSPSGSFVSCKSYEHLSFFSNKGHKIVYAETVDSIENMLEEYNDWSEKSDDTIYMDVNEIKSQIEAGNLPYQSLAGSIQTKQYDSGDIVELYKQYEEIFTTHEIDRFLQYFLQFDLNADGLIEVPELKLLLQKLSVPQDRFIAENVSIEHSMSFNEFLLFYSELIKNTGLPEKNPELTEVDVATVGVKGAKSFFEAKIDEQFNTGRVPETKKRFNATKSQQFNTAVCMFMKLDQEVASAGSSASRELLQQ